MSRNPEFSISDFIGPEFEVFTAGGKSFRIDDEEALHKSIESSPTPSFDIRSGKDELTVELNTKTDRELIDARVRLPHGRGPNGKTSELLGNVSTLLTEVASVTGKTVEFNLITDNLEIILWVADPNGGRLVVGWDEIGHLKSGKVCAVKRIEPLKIP